MKEWIWLYLFCVVCRFPRSFLGDEDRNDDIDDDTLHSKKMFTLFTYIVRDDVLLLFRKKNHKLERGQKKVLTQLFFFPARCAQNACSTFGVALSTKKQLLGRKFEALQKKGGILKHTEISLSSLPPFFLLARQCRENSILISSGFFIGFGLFTNHRYILRLESSTTQQYL